MFAGWLKIQKRLTEQGAGAVQSGVHAEGVAVMIDWRNLCMMMRGMQQQNSMLVVSYLLGPFRKSTQTREECFSLVSKPRVV